MKATLGVLLLLTLTVQPALAAVSIIEYNVPTPSSVPFFITAGADGNLWFTENSVSGNKIGKITTTGSITEYAVPTPNSGPTGITAGPDGNLWFAEFLDKIGKITTTGSITEYALPTPSSIPAVITTGPDGNLWFTETGGNKIGKITTTGSITEYPVPTLGSSPYGITPGPDGNLWFTEETSLPNNIGKVTTSGSITEYALSMMSGVPQLITTGPDGNLWFTESNGRIGKITTTGLITEYLVPTLGSGPFGITTGPDGNLWFTESAPIGNKIGTITTTGSSVEYAVPTLNSSPGGISAGPDGHLWFTEEVGNKIGEVVFPASTSMTANCSPSAVAVNQPAQCTATVTDTSASPSAPMGFIAFFSSGPGFFNPSNQCILMSASSSTSTCTVSYTPSPGAEGIHVITGVYPGGPAHIGSDATTSLTVTKRTTSTSVSCSPVIVHPHFATACTATLKDTSPGTPITPTGIVTWTSSGTGTFGSASCPLTGGILSCTVTYAPSPGRPIIQTIAATYGGDTDHFGSSGSASILVR